ncbi:MAG: MlaD family protein [Bacteroidota bacterium]|nr:MlaD family protein [Bacteroidota bacterium]
MKKTTGNKIKLGIFVTSSIVLLIAGIYFIGEKGQLFNNTFLISGVFKDISGLQVGNNVRFSGINVGIIDNIEQITDSTVRVDMIIDEGSRKFMKKNAKAIVGSDGLMGNKIVVIAPGTPGKKQLVDGDFIETIQPISIDDILAKLKVTADHSALITGDISAISGEIRAGRGTIGKLLMDSTFAEHVEETIINIKQGAGGFKQNMNAASKNVLLRGFFKKKKKGEDKKKK